MRLARVGMKHGSGSQKEATRAESRLSCSGNRTCVVLRIVHSDGVPLRGFASAERPDRLAQLFERLLGCLGAQCDCFVGAMNSKRPRRPRWGLTKTSGGSPGSRARVMRSCIDVEALDHNRRDVGTPGRLAEKLALHQLLCAEQAA